MKRVSVKKGGNPPLVAVIDSNGKGVYFRLGTGCVYVHTDGGAALNVHQSLESVLASPFGERLPVYKGDTLTIEF